MPRLPLNIPPGLRRAATQHATGPAWHDMSLVRWNNERMQAIGGWASLIGFLLADAVRALISWRDNTGGVWLGAASLGQIMVWNGGFASDITPSDFAAGALTDTLDGFGLGAFGEAEFGTPRDISTIGPDGFGVGGFGDGDFGTPRDAGAVVPIYLGPPNSQTTLCNWGEDLIVVGSEDGRILRWNPSDTTVPLAVIPPADPSPTEAPDIVHVVPLCWSAFVTDERFLVALQADRDPRRVAWCDQERLGAWTPDITNLAGALQLNTTGVALTARKVPQGYLIYCTDDVHLMTWAGPPYAYGIVRVGTACGPVGANAIATVLGHTVWMGRQSFWQWNGIPVPLVCPLQGFVFDNLSKLTAQRAFAYANGINPEIWFFYPDEDGIEANRYVIWNFETGNWYAGALDRTAGCEPASYALPLMGDATGQVYAHEYGLLGDGDDRGALVYAETGDIMLDAGDRATVIRAIIPDMENIAQVQVRLAGSWEPEDVLEDYGAFPYTRTDGIIDALVEARAIRLRIEGLTQPSPGAVRQWTLGRIALDVQPGSGR